MKKKRRIPDYQVWGVLLLICLAIWLFGFIVGRCTVSAKDKPIDNTVTAAETTELVEVTDDEITYEWLDFKATAYCSCSICCNGWANNRPVDKYGKEIVLTASGERAVEGVTIAADWSVLPSGTEVEIQGYGDYIVHDKGGAIKGNRIDVYFSSHDAAKQFGVQNVKLRVIE